MDEFVDAFLASSRRLAVAAAGCGKTELIARTVAHPRSGRQLVLTHTHSGVAALKRRFEHLRIPAEKYRLDTIAGWCLLYATAYPGLSGFSDDGTANPDWAAVYPAALRIMRCALGHRVMSASYDGVLVDEYQDCSLSQHSVIAAMAEVIPCRVVGDPLQAIFGFRQDDPMVPWCDVELFFERMPDLELPWRWVSANRALGDWLIEARTQLRDTGQLTIDRGAPVKWRRCDGDADVDCCRMWTGMRADRVVAIKKWPGDCISMASRLAGRFEVVERFDDRDLPDLAAAASNAAGPEVVRVLHGYVRGRMTRVGPELAALVDAIAAHRSTHRFRTHLHHRDRLETAATAPTPENLMSVLDGFRSERGWSIYRPDGWFQLRHALHECVGIGLGHLPTAVAAVRTRARHRGRHIPRRTLGTTLLVKGLEFDDAMVLDADALTTNELYVALTRASRSLWVLSAGRVLGTAANA